MTFNAHCRVACLYRGAVGVAVLGCLALTACGQDAMPIAITASMPPCPTCATCPTAIPSLTPGLISTPPPWPTPTGDEDILPAPLYYVSTHEEENGRQCPLPHIVRIERDGRTRTVIGSCFTSGGVDGFDVSPVDGSVVLAARGSLWIVDKDSENIEPLVTGLPDPEGGGRWFSVQDPVWSPDGTRIAYADGGIRILDMASRTRTDVIESTCDEVPIELPPCIYGGNWFLNPRWSPDGQALLFLEQTADYPIQRVFRLSVDNEPRIVPGTLGVYEQHNIIWSRDGSALLFDYWWPAFRPITTTEPAFVRVSRDDFAVQVLWPHGDRADPVYASGGNNPWQVLYPFETPDGRILFFQAEPCSTDSCYIYDIVEGRLTDEGFDMRIVRRDAWPEYTQDVVWYDSGEFIALVMSSDRWCFVAVMKVTTGTIFLLAEEDSCPGRILWGSP